LTQNHNPLVSIFSYCKTTNSEKLSKANDKPCSTHQVVTISAQMKNSLAFTHRTFTHAVSLRVQSLHLGILT